MSALLVLLLAAQAAPMPAPAASCTAAAPLPAGLAGWTRMRPLTAAADGRANTAATLPLGVGAKAKLLPVAQVRYAVPPEKPGAAGSFGGIMRFRVAAAGRYRVALGSGAWIDVIGNGKALPSVAHGHGPACTAVRKMVDFDLAAGDYALQVSGSTTPELAVMVAPSAR